jgi:hypothetical protein
LFESRRLAASQKVDEGARIIRWIAIAMGADDEIQEFFIGNFARLEIRHVDQAGC